MRWCCTGGFDLSFSFSFSLWHAIAKISRFDNRYLPIADCFLRGFMVETFERRGFNAVLDCMPAARFSTADFVMEYRAREAEEWGELESRFGRGGKGAGQYRTVNSHVADQLAKLARSGAIKKLDYQSISPDWWGSPVVQCWMKVSGSISEVKDIVVDREYLEGRVVLKEHLVRERAWGLAKKKKEEFRRSHGRLFCEVCGLDPVSTYGEGFGEAVIEVHHAAIAVSDMMEIHSTKLDELQCICANCHRIIHARVGAGG